MDKGFEKELTATFSLYPNLWHHKFTDLNLGALYKINPRARFMIKKTRNPFDYLVLFGHDGVSYNSAIEAKFLNLYINTSLPKTGVPDHQMRSLRYFEDVSPMNRAYILLNLRHRPTDALLQKHPLELYDPKVFRTEVHAFPKWKRAERTWFMLHRSKILTQHWRRKFTREEVDRTAPRNECLVLPISEFEKLYFDESRKSIPISDLESFPNRGSRQDPALSGHTMVWDIEDVLTHRL